MFSGDFDAATASSFSLHRHPSFSFLTSPSEAKGEG
jgi:hypothetical protein